RGRAASRRPRPLLNLNRRLESRPGVLRRESARLHPTTGAVYPVRAARAVDRRERKRLSAEGDPRDGVRSQRLRGKRRERGGYRGNGEGAVTSRAACTRVISHLSEWLVTAARPTLNRWHSRQLR